MIAPFILIGIVAGLLTASYLTNPFSRFTLIRRPFISRLERGMIKAINNNHRLTVRQGPGWKLFAMAKNGVHIISSRYIKSPPAVASSLEDIIESIHRKRFDPSKLLLISGDHFSSLFVRNLGVFYYPTLDGRIPSSKDDWRDRQMIYIQTLAYALGVFQKYPVPTTTIVSTGRYRATCVNIYAYPPDTVYAILYALAALLGKQQATPQDYTKPKHRLDTIDAARRLLDEYHDTLTKLYDHYFQTIYDPATGLVRRDRHFSGAKDITRRHCSFYDNIMLWKTASLAMDLSIISNDEEFLRQLKRRIIKTFWLEHEGHFLEDLSDEGIAGKYYSSEWLIVLATGFLDPYKTRERQYFERSVSYIQRQKLDQPFPLKYHHDTRKHRQFWAVRLAVASYGGDAIWSFWGMEYIKTLLLLYMATGKSMYLRSADQHIASYKQVMLRDGGFPETYDPQGRLLQTPLYRSIVQTGWVIGFEQAMAMRRAIKE